MASHSPHPEVAGPTDRIRALFAIDVRVSARDREQLLLTVGIPVLLLVFFSIVDVLPTGSGPSGQSTGDDAVDFLAPGILALALISVAFVRQAIGLGFDRGFGALRRYALSPLRPVEFLAAKTLTTAVLFAGQVTLLAAVALLLGWRPSIHIALGASVALGLVAFNALAYVLASQYDGLGALAIANGLYVVLLLVSGLVIDLGEFPAWLASAVKLLPSTALAALLRDNLAASPGPGWAWLCLAVWATAASALALKTFRWL